MTVNKTNFCTECQHAECHYAECRYAECHYAERHGAVQGVSTEEKSFERSHQHVSTTLNKFK